MIGSIIENLDVSHNHYWKILHTLVVVTYNWYVVHAAGEDGHVAILMVQSTVLTLLVSLLLYCHGNCIEGILEGGEGENW